VASATMAHDVDEWIIYARISDDREGAGLGVERQVKEAHAHHERIRLAGHVLAVLVDNDLTANDRSKRYKPRPQYTRLCELLAERPGRRGVIAWHTDRLHRTPRELEDFIDVVETSGAAVQTVRSGPVDLTTPAGRMFARQMCAVARYESEHKSERIRLKMAELASSGGIISGGKRPFGYTRVYEGVGNRRRIVRDEINPEEAAVICECVRRVLAGDSLSSVTRWLRDSGVPTALGATWEIQTISQVLKSPRIAGLAEHRGTVVGTASWPAIITVEEHEQLTALFAERAGRPAMPLKYYLSGYVYCSDCAERGVHMRGGMIGGKARYRCEPQRGGCNGRAIGLQELEVFMDRWLLTRMRDPRFVAGVTAREADTSAATRQVVERIAADENRLALMQAALEGDADAEAIPEVVASMRTIRRRISEAKELLSGMSVQGRLVLNLEQVALRWQEASIATKRAVVKLAVDRVLILPGVRGRNFFDPARVQVVPAP
jgi:site-specific DNA recombinase